MNLILSVGSSCNPQGGFSCVYVRCDVFPDFILHIPLHVHVVGRGDISTSN